MEQLHSSAMLIGLVAIVAVLVVLAAYWGLGGRARRTA